MRPTRFLISLFVLIPAVVLGGPNRWTSSGLSGVVITHIVADPTQAVVAYAATNGAGIFKTSDGGASWQPANDGLSQLFISALIALPTSPTTLYAAVRSRIFITTDASRHWSFSGDVGGNEIHSLAYDSGSHTLYAGTDHGIFVTRDDGQTWTQSPSLTQFVSSIAVAPNGTAYALGFTGDTLFSSTDHGETWTVAFQTWQLSASEVAIDPDTSAIYLFGSGAIYASDDARNWNTLPLWPGGAAVSSVIPAGPAHIYAGANSGAFEYRSGTWSRIGGALSPVSALAVTPSAPRRFYAATFDSGVVTSVEHETDWTPANYGLCCLAANDVEFAAENPAVAYAAQSGGLFRTDDSGQDWRNILRSERADLVEVSSANADTVFAAASQGLWKTSDGGATWKIVKPQFTSALAIAKSNPSTMYAAFVTDLTSKSSDGGETWSTINSGITLGYYDGFGFSMSSLNVDPSTESTAYAGRPEGIYKTTDGGKSWRPTAPYSNARALAIDPATRSIIYAAPDSVGVYKSTDGGETWAGSGLMDKRVLSLAIAGSLVFAATSDGFVYRSIDGGQQWTGFDDGLTRASIDRLRVDDAGQHFYAATRVGVYEYHVVPDDVPIEPLAGSAIDLPQLFDTAAINSGFVLPVVGTTNGSNGALFTTEITLTNDRDSKQDVMVAFLPQAWAFDPVRLFRLTLSPGSHRMDFGERFDISGIGALAVAAIDAGGNVDSNASISGAARVWMHPSGDRAPQPQSIASASLAARANAAAAGMRQDSRFRTNIGVVNLSAEMRQFILQINGERASGQLTFAVPPFALMQTALPDENYGAFSVTVLPDVTTRFAIYGSTIDRMTGEARTGVGN